MKIKTYTVTEKIHIFNITAPWMYIPIPIEKVPKIKTRGWGSIPVMVTLGKTTWRTSLFPIKKDNYFVPVKKAVAKKENVFVGDLIKISYVVAKV